MICPKCGYANPDNAAQCAHCYYKFRFGHAYNDPAAASFPSLGSSKKMRLVRLIFFLFFILLFIFMIFMSIKSA